MWRARRDEHERHAVACAETMLAIAPHVRISLDLLELLRHRFEQRLGMIDGAEPTRRAELELLVVADFDELATTFKRLARIVKRMPKA